MRFWHMQGSLMMKKAFLKEHGIEKNPESLRTLATMWLDPLNADNYVLMSNFYAENGKQEMVDIWRETIKDMDLKPKSWSNGI